MMELFQFERFVFGDQQDDQDSNDHQSHEDEATSAGGATKIKMKFSIFIISTFKIVFLVYFYVTHIVKHVWIDEKISQKYFIAYLLLKNTFSRETGQEIRDEILKRMLQMKIGKQTWLYFNQINGIGQNWYKLVQLFKTKKAKNKKAKKGTFYSDLGGRRFRPEVAQNRDFRFRSKSDRKIRTESSPPEDKTQYNNRN